MGCSGCSTGANGKPAGCKSNGYCATSGCQKLGVFDWLAGVPLPDGSQAFDGVEVRFKNTRKAFYRNSTGLSLMPGDLVTVDASPGHDIGMVSLTGELVRVQMDRRNQTGETYELRKILRKSSQEDIDRWHDVRKLEDETLFATRNMVRDAGLDMKLTDVEYQGDGTRAIFYYTAEERIDFRGIVRQISDRFKVRVEMKQIGARQEAGRIGGIGSCGRELCCSTWLTDFRSVTTSAARYQQLALNPQKLAGQCGKLKCCLNYELDMYIEAIKSYPSQNAKLRTKQGTGAHIKTDIFTAKMWYAFKRPGEPFIMAGFPVETVREILAQNKQGVEPEVDLNMVDTPAPDTVKAPDYENVVGQDELTRFDSKLKGARKRGRKKKPLKGVKDVAARPDGGPMHVSGEGIREERGQRRDRRKNNASEGRGQGENKAAPQGTQAKRDSEGRGGKSGRRRRGRGGQTEGGGPKPPAPRPPEA